MKKAFLFLLFIALGSLNAQYVSYDIHVKSQATNSWLSNYPVWVVALDSNDKILNQRTHYTTSSGKFIDTITFRGNIAKLKFITYDCNADKFAKTLAFSTSPAHRVDTLTIPCGGNPDCGDIFTYTRDTLTVYFQDNSTLPGVSGTIQSFYWSFGDGNISSLRNPVHTYSTAGVYTVGLHVAEQDTTDSLGYCNNSYVRQIWAGEWPAIGCNASFDALVVDSVLLLRDFSTSSPAIPGIRKETVYDYGDGSSGSDSLHHYSASGTYQVCQTVYILTELDSVQDTLCTSQYCDSVIVTSPAPDTCHSDFTYTQDTTEPFDPFFYSFSEDGYHSSGVPGYRVEYIWTINDTANTDSLNGANINYTFSDTGYYEVCLFIVLVDPGNSVICSSQECKTIYVSESDAFCEAYYIVDTANSFNGEVYIWNMSTPLESDSLYNTSYLWNFGDGSTSTQPFPTHAYTNEGIYTVCLTVTSYNQTLDSCSSVYCDTLGVDSNGQLVYKSATGFLLKVLNPETIDLEENELLNVNIYPNPADDLIRVDMGSSFKGRLRCALTDMKGSLVSSGTFALEKGDVISMDISRFKAGMYILTVESDYAISHHRIRIGK